jgi:hypothetical protein
MYARPASGRLVVRRQVPDGCHRFRVSGRVFTTRGIHSGGQADPAAVRSNASTTPHTRLAARVRLDHGQQPTASRIGQLSCVLPPDGRFAVSGVLADPDMDDATRRRGGLDCCVAGALTKDRVGRRPLPPGAWPTSTSPRPIGFTPTPLR